MSEDAKFNFFSQGPRELSHSAFWSWVLQAIDAPKAEELEDVKALGNTLLECVRFDKTGPWKEVVCERKIEGGRADIYANNSEGDTTDRKHVLIVENKLGAVANEEQVKKYRQSGHVVLLDAGFDFGNHNQIRKLIGEDRVLDRQRLLELLGQNKPQHALLKYYHSWLHNWDQEIKEICRQVEKIDGKGFYEAFNTAEGNWHFAEIVLPEPNNRSDNFTHGTSRGRPWTQFWLELPPNKKLLANDALLWRFDTYTDGPSISLRQYNKKSEAKRKRYERLCAIWDQILEQNNGFGLEWRGPHGTRGGYMESEIVAVFLKDNKDRDIETLKTGINDATKAFRKQLQKEGKG